MSRKPDCKGGFCLLNPLDLPIVCQECPRYDRGLLRKLKHESSPIEDIIREDQICPICGKMFFDRANKSYCSPPCCKKAYRLRKLARTTEDHLKAYEWRECVICHNQYYPHTDQQKTCGGKCSEEYMRRTYKRGIGIRSKHLQRIQYTEEQMKTTILNSPVFNLQFRRLGKTDTIPVEDLKRVVKYLDANQPWWSSLNMPRQAVVLHLAYNVGESFLDRFRNVLLFIRMCRWSDAKSGILSNSWARSNGAKAVELARQVESGEWQRDPLEQLKEEEENEQLKQGSLI